MTAPEQKQKSNPDRNLNTKDAKVHSPRIQGLSIEPNQRGSAPDPWQSDLQSVLISAKELKERVREIGEILTQDYRGKDLVIVALLNGTALFFADLIRQIELPMRIDFMGISSYRDQTVGGEIVMTKNLQIDISGSSVLLVDDILDSGATLERAMEMIASKSPGDLKTCVLLEKPARRTVPIEADYVGFTIPDEFVVGYGLDYADLYRNLPFIGALHPRVYGAEAR